MGLPSFWQPLVVELTLSIVSAFAAVVGLAYILIRIEWTNTLASSLWGPDIAQAASNVQPALDLTLKVSTTTTTTTTTTGKSSSPAGPFVDVSRLEEEEEEWEEEEEEGPVRIKISRERRLILAFTVVTLTLLTWLLLVLSNAAVFWRWLGLGLVLIVLVHPWAAEEIRRGRFDRLMLFMSHLLLLTMSMQFAAHAHQLRREGNVYQGPARIVGYDTSHYQAPGAETVTRADLQVAWGGAWACPGMAQTECRALIQGALCESNVVDPNNDDSGRRRLESSSSSSSTWATVAQAVNHSNNIVSTASQNQTTDTEQNGPNATDTTPTVGPVRPQDNSAYNDYTPPLDDSLYGDSEPVYYGWDDDYYDNDYWNGQDWQAIWGEYACSDLFGSDLLGQSYDTNNPPGQDAWPFVNIYGNCRTCQAYIIDYYSTEHFQAMAAYQTAGRHYAVAWLISLLLYAVVAWRQDRPSGKGGSTSQLSSAPEIELLPSGTSRARSAPSRRPPTTTTATLVMMKA